MPFCGFRKKKPRSVATNDHEVYFQNCRSKEMVMSFAFGAKIIPISTGSAIWGGQSCQWPWSNGLSLDLFYLGWRA